MTDEMTWVQAILAISSKEGGERRCGEFQEPFVHNERIHIMHPFDCSLDTSFHKHSHQPHHQRKQARRSSLDNGCFYDKHDLMSIASASLDDSSHGSRAALPRRRSLNTALVIPTTFLASSTAPKVNKITSDLDLDCHIWVNESPQNYNNNNKALYPSSHHTKPVAMEVTDDEQDSDRRHNESCGSTDFDPNEDSFCEASFAEQANKEYMMRDLGASCFLDDDMLHDMDDDKVDDLAAFEALENDEHEATERGGGDGFEGDVTATSEDCASFCDANDRDQANRDYLVKDLGASCFWASHDDIYDVPVDDGKRTIAFDTITEEMI
jgi:hypothetical protein